MDTELLNEICKRVQEKLQAIQLPSILVLTEEHGTICHETLENTELGRYYRMECALLADYQCSVKDCGGRGALYPVKRSAGKNFPMAFLTMVSPDFWDRRF